MALTTDPTRAILTLTEAKALVKAINNCSMWQIIGRDEYAPDLSLLEKHSLAECLKAVWMVKREDDRHNEALKKLNGGQRFHILPDDRLIAAAYALANYHISREPVVSAPATKFTAKALGILSVEIEQEEEETCCDGGKTSLLEDLP